MALHQLFTLAFALQLEPLPTLDYATVPYVRDSERSTDSLQDPQNLRVGANTKLEPTHHRHLPHSVDTLSFLLNHTRAIDAVEPFSKLIRLLDEADDDPQFRNLREFFDARYDQSGLLVGADKDPRRRVRSISRAASTKQAARRSSQAAEGRKPSFAASLGGASALKLNWLRRNNNSESYTHEGSDDEDTHSKGSSSGQHTNVAPPSAPYIRLAKHPHSASPSSPPTSSARRSQTTHDTTNLVTFHVRLDLHTVGLAPPPPKLRPNRPAESSGAGLQRIGSGRSATSSEWRKRRARKSSLGTGDSTLRPVISPESMASFGAVSAAANGDSDFQQADSSGFTIETNDQYPPEGSSSVTKTRPTIEIPSHPTIADAQLPSITEGAITSPQQITSPASSTKPSRRPSMMSKLRSFLDRHGSDAPEDQLASPAPSHHDEASELRTAPNATGHRANFHSGFHHHPHHGTPSNEEALDLDEEEEEGASRAQMMRQSANGASAQSRRRSSAGSSSKHQAASAKQVTNNLGPVQEDGMLDLTMVSSRSTVGTSFSDHVFTEEFGGENVSTGAAPGQTTRRRLASVMDGGDFLSLFRTASGLVLTSIDEHQDVAEGNSDEVTTPGQENVRSPRQRQAHLGDTGSAGSPSNRTPQVHPKTSSLPATPGQSIRSLDLDRSPNFHSGSSNPIDASFKLGAALSQQEGDDQEGWWPCGEVDPLPVGFSSALGEALGWEGIMHLCYGKGSRAASTGSYVALGKAAALDQANKAQERTVQAWRSGVVSPGTSPSKHDQTLPSLLDVGGPDATNLANSLAQKLNLDPVDSLPSTTYNASLLERLHGKAPRRSSTVPDPNGLEEILQGNGIEGANPVWTEASLLFGSKVNHSRTWEHWHALFKSIKGWIDEYEKARVRGGLAREIGLDAPVQQSEPDKETDDRDQNITISAPIHIDPDHPDLQVPLTIGSPPSASTEVLKVAKDKVDATMLSKVLGTSLSISPCVLADATNRSFGFRRRGGIPEGLPLGPELEETVDYTWSRKRLSVEHFATALTISSDSALHYFDQLSNSHWPHGSAWELDYLEMCVFKSPLVADRFPPPGDAIVPASQSYRPTDGMEDRSRVCPNPDGAGAWDPDTWKRWLTSIREGDIIVPAIAWQAWWTLISVLNGADRTGRSYDLQVKSEEEPYEALSDLNAVYL